MKFDSSGWYTIPKQVKVLLNNMRFPLKFPTYFAHQQILPTIMRIHRIEIVKFVLLCFLLAFLLSGCDSTLNHESQGNFPTPSPTPNPRADLQVPGLKELVNDFNVAPLMPENPSLADLGSQHYYQICLACHGDWGQGLTDEWRAQWDEDENCWKSKCHASNHPPEGFDLPKSIPPVLGIGSIARLKNGEELHSHIFQTMPWWNPGMLTEEQAWQLSGYLLRERGEMENSFPLNAGTAPAVRLHVATTPRVDNRPGAFLLVGSLTVVTLLYVTRRDASS
jgi:hypothetical protein